MNNHNFKSWLLNIKGYLMYNSEGDLRVIPVEDSLWNQPLQLICTIYPEWEDERITESSA